MPRTSVEKAITCNVIEAAPDASQSLYLRRRERERERERERAYEGRGVQSASEQREGKPQVCGKRGGLLREMRDERLLQALFPISVGWDVVYLHNHAGGDRASGEEDIVGRGDERRVERI